MENYNIAIDGPAAAGKSTAAKTLARVLSSKGFIYIDTGAMYRAVALHCINKGIGVNNAGAVTAALPDINIELKYGENGQMVILNGEDVTGLIRTEGISMAASDVSAIPSVREFLVKMQQGMAKEGNVIMDGRDIGTVVLPDADLKIYLDASLEERAKRRELELCGKGIQTSLADVENDLRTRDYNDSHRAASPLKQAEDAVYIDSTGKMPCAVVVEILLLGGFADCIANV